jgi:hypothetical protein
MRFRLIGLDEADALARRQAHDFAQRLASVRQVCAYPSE